MVIYELFIVESLTELLKLCGFMLNLAKVQGRHKYAVERRWKMATFPPTRLEFSPTPRNTCFDSCNQRPLTSFSVFHFFSVAITWLAARRKNLQDVLGGFHFKAIGYARHKCYFWPFGLNKL